MASLHIIYLFTFFVIALASATSLAQLNPFYYDKSCPSALPTIKQVVEAAVDNETRMGASLLRLQFHDCFVNGCDGSILLDPAPNIDSEKNAFPNLNSARGFEVIDQIKSAVDKACGGPVVSCADILAVAARDSVVKLGGLTWPVLLGRRDSTTANRTTANTDLPSPFLDRQGLIDAFQKQGLNQADLVVLSGGHTIGFAQCGTFKNRIHNETNIDPQFAQERRNTCPPNGGDTNLAPLDLATPTKFDRSYYNNLLQNKGLLHSDQALFSGGQSFIDSLVRFYGSSWSTFPNDFAVSMIKMGNIKPLTGNQGQVRLNCRKVNP